MSNQWKAVDNVANSPIWLSEQFNLGITAGNTAVLYNNTTPSGIISGKTVGSFDVDVNQIAATRVAATEVPGHTGWNLRTVGTGGRAGRVTYETLVAMSSVSNVSNNTIIPAGQIRILTQPASSNVNVNAAVSFTVSAVALGGLPIQLGGGATLPQGTAPNITIVYLWQVDQGNGSWMNVAQTGVYTGNTTPTLSISNNALLKANTYRVILSAANGAPTVTSANAVLQNF